MRAHTKLHGGPEHQHLSRNNNYQGGATNAIGNNRRDNLDSSLLTIQFSGKRRKSVGYNNQLLKKNRTINLKKIIKTIPVVDSASGSKITEGEPES